MCSAISLSDCSKSQALRKSCFMDCWNACENGSTWDISNHPTPLSSPFLPKHSNSLPPPHPGTHDLTSASTNVATVLMSTRLRWGCIITECNKYLASVSPAPVQACMSSSTTSTIASSEVS